MTDRIDLKSTAAAVGVAVALTGCRPVLRRSGLEATDAFSGPVKLSDQEVKVIHRLGFGHRPSEFAAIAKLGTTAFIEQQLRADQPEPVHLELAVNRLDVFRMDSMELRDIPEYEVIRQLQNAAILRAVYSPNQLRERMVDFWTNHFNIYGRKGFAAYRKGKDETLVVRKHALGSFAEMLHASASSPAMLVYLDNNFNQSGIPNENYARELLELHTLGVKGGYTYDDIKNVARCFTGWTIETGFLKPVGKLVFRPELHDDGPKVVLGQRIPAGGGEKDREDVLKILLNHPSTAKFIAQKLCKHFLGAAPKSVVERSAQEFLRSGGDIKATLEPILFGPESGEAQSPEQQIKRPFDFLVSTLRVTDADISEKNGLHDHLRAMGQPTYEWPMPDGYPQEVSAWTGSLLARWNFALDLTSGRIKGVTSRLAEHAANYEGGALEHLLLTVLGFPTNEGALFHQLNGLYSESPVIASALALASPEFQWRTT